MAVGGSGKLSFELDALTSISDQIAVAGTLTIGSDVLGFSDFAFTNLGGLEAGTYTLITSGGVSGRLDPADLTGVIGGFTGTLQFNGNSLKLIVSATGAGYASWQSANGATGQALNQDHDGDGVPNGIEYFLVGPNGTSSGFTALPGIVKDPGTGALSVTWPKGSGYAGTYGTHYWVETSETLADPWTPETLAPSGQVTDTASTVTYTFPTPLGSKKFARLMVTGP